MSVFAEEKPPVQPSPIEVYHSWANKPGIAALRTPGKKVALRPLPPKAKSVKIQVRGRRHKINLIRLCEKGLCRFESQQFSILEDVYADDLINGFNFKKSEYVMFRLKNGDSILVERVSLGEALKTLGYIES